MSKRLGKNDIIFIVIIFAVIAIVSGIVLFLGRNPGASIVITVDGEFYLEASLDKNQEIDITNKAGDITNHLVIENGTANMIDANCPDKLCVKQKAIHYDMESIICLPNKVVVTVSSEDKSEYDVIAE